MTERPVTLRTVPSAGARHAFETWLLVNRVQGLDAGLYRYQALAHKLFHLKASQDICEQVTLACLSQKQVREILDRLRPVEQRHLLSLLEKALGIEPPEQAETELPPEALETPQPQEPESAPKEPGELQGPTQLTFFGS
mgnify:CR=1 FL=1